MTKKLFIKTFGCQMNEYDSSRIIDLLKEKLNVQCVTKPEDADIILMNTCSVREKPQEKVFSDLGRYRLIKNEKPHLLIGVGGCVASQFGQEILSRAPFVNVIFGPQTLHRLPDLLQKTEKTGESVIDVSFPEIEKFDHLPAPHVEGTSAYVTIMEGCNNYCSYCIVPYVRGKEISRPFEDVMNEIKTLAQKNIQEITLLGQNVNHYQCDSKTLSDIIYQTAQTGIKRIRFMTSHPAYLSDDLIQTYQDVPQLASHLHLPVQSGSDKILMLMKRRYTVDDYRALVEKLCHARSGLSISSDFIVGFPGETDRDFEATLRLVRDVGFDHSFSFMYSERPGTAAARFEDDVPLAVKKERLNRLQAELMQQENKISQWMQETLQRVLVTGFSKRNKQELTARTENNRTVNFVGPEHLIGQFIQIKMTRILHNSLRGEIIHS